jgi:hypothetical protein
MNASVRGIFLWPVRALLRILVGWLHMAKYIAKVWFENKIAVGAAADSADPTSWCGGADVMYMIALCLPLA